MKKTYNPTHIYLFGSYAYGTPNDESDLDYLVVVKDSKKPFYLRSQDGEAALFGSKIPTDILVTTEKELAERLKNDPLGLYKQIVVNGKKI